MAGRCDCGSRASWAALQPWELGRWWASQSPLGPPQAWGCGQSVSLWGTGVCVLAKLPPEPLATEVARLGTGAGVRGSGQCHLGHPHLYPVSAGVREDMTPSWGDLELLVVHLWACVWVPWQPRPVGDRCWGGHGATLPQAAKESPCGGFDDRRARLLSSAAKQSLAASWEPGPLNTRVPALQHSPTHTGLPASGRHKDWIPQSLPGGWPAHTGPTTPRRLGSTPACGPGQARLTPEEHPASLRDPVWPAGVYIQYMHLFKNINMEK